MLQHAHTLACAGASGAAIGRLRARVHRAPPQLGEYARGLGGVAVADDDLAHDLRLDHREQGVGRGSRGDVGRGDSALLVAADPPGGGVAQPHDVGLPLGRHAVHLAGQPRRQLEHRRVAIDRRDGGGERAVQLAARVAGAVEVGCGGLVDLGERELDEAVDDRPLVGEVEVERGAADVGSARDRVDRDPLEGLLRQRLAGGVEDQRLGVVARGVG